MVYQKSKNQKSIVNSLQPYTTINKISRKANSDIVMLEKRERSVESKPIAFMKKNLHNCIEIEVKNPGTVESISKTVNSEIVELNKQRRITERKELMNSFNRIYKSVKFECSVCNAIHESKVFLSKNPSEPYTIRIRDEFPCLAETQQFELYFDANNTLRNAYPVILSAIVPNTARGYVKEEKTVKIISIAKLVEENNRINTDFTESLDSRLEAYKKVQMGSEIGFKSFEIAFSDVYNGLWAEFFTESEIKKLKKKFAPKTEKKERKPKDSIYPKILSVDDAVVLTNNHVKITENKDSIKSVIQISKKEFKIKLEKKSLTIML
jgi:hypothetical protein